MFFFQLFFLLSTSPKFVLTLVSFLFFFLFSSQKTSLRTQVNTKWTKRKWDGPMQYTNSASGDDLMMLPTDMVCAFFFESREARAPELERRPWRAVSLVSFRTRGGGKKREGKTQRGEEEKTRPRPRPRNLDSRRRKQKKLKTALFSPRHSSGTASSGRTSTPTRKTRLSSSRTLPRHSPSSSSWGFRAGLPLRRRAPASECFFLEKREGERTLLFPCLDS